MTPEEEQQHGRRKNKKRCTEERSFWKLEGSSHRNKDLGKIFNYNLCLKEVSSFRFAGVGNAWVVCVGRQGGEGQEKLSSTARFLELV